MAFTVSEPKKAELAMRFDYEQCSAPDRKHTTILVEKDGEAHMWLCVECGMKFGVMKVR